MHPIHTHTHTHSAGVNVYISSLNGSGFTEINLGIRPEPDLDFIKMTQACPVYTTNRKLNRKSFTFTQRFRRLLTMCLPIGHFLRFVFETTA